MAVGPMEFIIASFLQLRHFTPVFENSRKREGSR